MPTHGAVGCHFQNSAASPPRCHNSHHISLLCIHVPPLELELSRMGGYVDVFRCGVNTCRNVFTYKANDVR